MNTTEKFDFIINRRSGTVLHKGEKNISRDLLKIFGAQGGEIHFVEGKDLAATVRAWVNDPENKGKGIIIGGGDGSVLTAATEMMGREDITLGVLPLGTHNLFARQLGFAADFRKAAAQYKDSVPASVDVGSVNGMNFLCGLMLGDNCVNFYEAREEVRDKKIVSAMKKVFSLMADAVNRRKTHLDVSSTEHAGKIFVVSNNAMTPRKVSRLKYRNVKTVVEDALARDNQTNGQLAFYAISAKPEQLASVLNSVLNGTWTEHKSVTVQMAPTLTIRPADGADAQKQVQIVLDGEIRKADFPLEVKIIPKSLKVYRPAP